MEILFVSYVISSWSVSYQKDGVISNVICSGLSDRKRKPNLSETSVSYEGLTTRNWLITNETSEMYTRLLVI